MRFSKFSAGEDNMISHRAQAALERGWEWEERGNLPKAIKAYLEATAIEHDWEVPHQRLGALYLEMSRYDEAAAAYQRAKCLAPPDDGSIDDLLHVIGLIQAGALNPATYRRYVMARDMPDDQLDQKMALCQEALSLNPTFAPPYAVLGKVLLARGHTNQARVVLERGLACDPTPFTQAMLLFDLGNVFLVSGLRDEALNSFRQAVKLNANPSVTRFATIQLEAAAAGRI
jgi:tetratricopeptide (TPR) repeat protein